MAQCQNSITVDVLQVFKSRDTLKERGGYCDKIPPKPADNPHASHLNPFLFIPVIQARHHGTSWGFYLSCENQIGPVRTGSSF